MNQLLNGARIGLLLLLISTNFPGYANATDKRDDVPRVGERMPDITFKDVRHYSRRSVSIREFEGRWLILDLWGISCHACVKSFPKINSLQEEFRKEVQFFLVGLKDDWYNDGIEKVYERVYKNLNVNLPSAFDSTLAKRWGISSVPHIYIISPDGIVRFITDGRDMNAEKIRKLIRGEEVSFYDKDQVFSRPKFQPLAGIPHEKIGYASILTDWNGERIEASADIAQYVRLTNEKFERGWSLAMMRLSDLYNYAYHGRSSWLSADTAFYGRVWRLPILEVSDSTAFTYDFTYNVGKGTYNFYLRIPREQASEQVVMTQLQDALRLRFGYEVVTEFREMPYWRLVASEKARRTLPTKHEERFSNVKNSVTGFTLRNYGVSEFLVLVTANLPNDEFLPFLDETGIEKNIDISIDTDMTHWPSVLKALNAYGLDLVKGSKLMKVIIIRERL